MRPLRHADNDPLNKEDPLGLRAPDAGMQAAALLNCAGGEVITTPGNPSLHQSMGTAQCLPWTPGGGLNWIPGSEMATLLAFHGYILLHTSSPAAEAAAFPQAVAAIASGADLGICATAVTSVGGGFGPLSADVLCIWNAPASTVAAFVVNDDALAYTQGHYVFCKLKEHCGSPTDVRFPNQLAHELVHVRQWENDGDLFAAKYLSAEASGNSGQCGNPYEREAYEVAPIYSDGRGACS